jgi:hypothetical protein
MTAIKQSVLFLAFILAFLTSTAQVSVTATAGSGTGTYTTINAAFAAINAGTHQGVINLTITANTTEPATPTSLVASGSGSASYSRITIRPSGNRTVSSAATPATHRGMLELFGAQHVTIDGDDPATAGSQNLSFVASTTTTADVSVIRLGATNTIGTGGASYDTIENCIITGPRNSATSTVISSGIEVAGNSTTVAASSGSNYATACSNNSFINNSITRCYYGIQLIGNNSLRAANLVNQSTLIMNDTLGSTDSTKTNIYNIYCYYYKYDTMGTTVPGATIVGNDIRGNCVAAANIYGIYYYYSSSGSIYGNHLHDISSSGSSQYVYGIYAYTAIAISNISVHDNVIENFTSHYYIYALYAYAWTSNSSSVLSIYNNTVDNLSAIGTTGYVYAFYSYSNDIHDNTISRIYANGGGAYGLYAYSPGNIYRNRVSDIRANSAYGAVGYYGGAANFYNNFIGKLSCKATSTTKSALACIGAYIPYSAGRFDNNTIALDTPDLSGSVANAFSACIFTVASPASPSFRNNILTNTKPSTNASGVCVSSPATWAGLESNNCIYVPSGNVGYTSSQNSLAQWQTATGKEANSISVNAPFVSLSDLHIDTNNLAKTAFYHTGAYMSNLTTDIDGQTRNAPPCIGADEFGPLIIVPDSVWPGDANADHLVDHTDLLPIGQAYDSTGPVRTQQGIVWRGYSATDWSHQFATGVNYKHADCNGDGIVNATDTNAISQNFGLTHHKTNGYHASYRSSSPTLGLQFSKDTVLRGDTLIVSFILGDTNTTVSNIYGLAFTYHYDPTTVDSTSPDFTFETSWFGNSSNSINFHRVMAGAGTVVASITGIDHINRSGQGEIARIRSIITTDNINGKTLSYYRNVSYVSDITAIDASGNSIDVNTAIDSNQVGYTPAGISQPEMVTTKIYPNPASGLVNVSSSSPMTGISISDILGQVVYRFVSDHKLNETVLIPYLEPGIYTVDITTTAGHTTDRLTIKK